MGIKRYLGGVVSANPDTPTVESASGVWTVEEAYQNIGNWPMAGNQIQNSLRFDSAASAYMNWTPSGTGGRSKFTYSIWLKVTKPSTQIFLLSAPFSTTQNGSTISIESTGQFYAGLRLYNTGSQGTFDAECYSNMLFRDPSAWYHIVFSLDTTASSADAMKLYVNGVSQTFASYDAPTASAVQYIGSEFTHYIGSLRQSVGTLDGYLTEVNFIDGLALGPEYFGFTDGNGIWQPKPYKGAYGTNGFYLPMTESATAQGFSTVTYAGNSGTQKISGVGFRPDFVWTKQRNAVDSHILVDSVRGDYALRSNSTAAQYSTGVNFTFDPDGFSMFGTTGELNYASYTYVSWCWQAGGPGGSSNTDGTITSTVSANTDYGFSIITHTGTGSNGTIGHGLGVAPKFVLTKRSSAIESWTGWHTGLSGGTYNIELNTTNGEQNSPTHYTAVPTSSVINLGTNTASNASGSTYVTYAFAEISGYSKFGSYTGNGSSTGPTVTTGFKPAFVITKGINGTTTYKNWNLHDNTRDTVNPVSKFLQANSTGAEGDTGALNIQFNDDGFQILSTDPGLNTSGDTYIYAAFADTRAYSFWDDQSGNGNNWQPNNIGFEDIMVDSPTNFGTDTGAGGEVRGNYCTLNPLDKGPNGVMSNGNLDWVYSVNSTYQGCGSTFAIPKSGQWYMEFQVTAAGGANQYQLSLAPSDATRNGSGYNATGAYSWIGSDSEIRYSGTAVLTSQSFSTSDIIGIAVDDGEVTFYKNGSSVHTFTTNMSAVSKDYFMGLWVTNGSAGSFNFGQKPFAYAAPSGYKALCTQNLPEPTVVDGGEYFNTLLYTGDGVSGRTLTGVGFQPDFTWIKNRADGSDDNQLYDAVRTAGKLLKANTTDAEATTTGGLTAFAPDGFVTGSSHGTNASGQGIVAWNWKAGGTGVSNTDGSITSTVSANTTAGFSIVTYTGTGSNATVGHGLGVAPRMIIAKRRDAVENWPVYHAVPGPNQYAYLDVTQAFSAASSVWQNVTPTSTVFSIGTSTTTNASGGTYVAYCFAPVEGYSAFGSYVGNGSTDGPFVYTGFRPKFVLIKKTSTGGGDRGWLIEDSARGTYNPNDPWLYANTSDAESTNQPIDFLSNGFKIRNDGLVTNNSGVVMIYAAFAENPFKISRAR